MPHAQRASKMRCLQLAIVVDNKDGDGNPGYRVKVKFPWLNDQDTTYWARIAVPMAGPERGTYVLPEIDDKEGAEKVIIVDKTKKNKFIIDSVNKLVKIECDGDIEVIAKANVIMHSNALKVGTS